MTNDPLYNRLCELSWRRKLTAAEEAQLRAWLAEHPEAQADWEAEAGLDEALSRLPDVPVASNFTARVLQAAEREDANQERARERKRRVWHWPFRWLPKAALAAIMLSAGLLSYQQAQVASRRARAESMKVVAEVASLPSPTILEDFDAIRVLDQTPPADEELLKLMQ